MKNRRNKEITTRPLAICLLATLLLAGTAVGEVSREGLVGEWHFDEGSGNVVKDSSGNGYDGTIYGSTWVDGKFGQAGSFDGTDDYIAIPDKPEWDFGSNSFTIAWWEYRTSNTDGKSAIARDGTTIYAPWVLGYNNLGNSQIWMSSNGGSWDIASAKSLGSITLNVWNYFVVRREGKNFYAYKNNVQTDTWSSSASFPANLNPLTIGHSQVGYYFNGIIDEVRIYNRALAASEIKELYEGEHTSLSITKSASPYSLRQFQESTIKVLIENTGTTEVRAIEIMDSVHPSFDLTGGDFPNPKKFDIVRVGESRELQYTIKSKESGAFTLDPATVTYADNKGNIQETKSESVSIKVVPSTTTATVPVDNSSSEICPASSAVLLHGEKTDVVLGEDILLKLSAVNLITKPPMSVQVMIYPPSGMSVTGSEFVKSGAGIYTTTYTLNPGDGKDIEVHIQSNQVGDFNVKGRIVYYFGEVKDKAEDCTLNLPIKVRKEIASTQEPAGKSTSGFGAALGAIAVLFTILLLRRR